MIAKAYMVITDIELKQDFEKYVALASTQDVLITQNGEMVAKLVPTHKNKLSAKEKLEILDSLVGIIKGTNLPDNYNPRNDRLSKQ